MKKFDLKKGLVLLLFIFAATTYSQDNTIRLTSNGVAIGGLNPDEGTTLAQDDTTLSIDAAGAVTVSALDPDYTLGSNTGVVTFADALNKTFNIRLKAALVIDQTPGPTYGAITTAGGIDRAGDGAIGVRPATGTTNWGIENGEGITFGLATPNLPTSVTLQITRIYFSTFGAAESGVIVNRRDTSKKIEFVGPATGNNIIIDVDSLDLNVRGGSTLFEMVSIFNNSSTAQSWRVTQIEFRLVETNSLTTVWNGSVWSAFTPGPAMDAVIEGNYSALATGGFSAKKLTINSGTLSIEATKAVKVDNELINNAGPTGVVVYSGGGLRQVNNTVNTGAITVKRISNPLSRLDSKAWSSPIANQNLLSFSPATLSTNFLNYNEGTNQFVSEASPSTTDFSTAGGYLIGMPDDAVAAPLTQTFEGIFTGVTNNGDITKAITYGSSSSLGYNLVGNPYPSAIIANSFINANIANIDGSIYFYRKTSSTSGSAYAMYSRLGATNLVASSADTNAEIPVGEGFIVKAKNNADLTFTNAMRIASVPATLTADRVWLNLTSTSGAFSQALVGYVADGTLGVDNYDGKYINDSPVALSSNLNNEEYTIQARPAFDASDEVSLNFKTDQAGDYTIGVDHFDGVFSAGQEIYLKDNTNGTFTDLRTNSYTFTAAAGTDNSRFVLRYTAASYPIAATAGDNGSVSGAGTYNTYSTATLIATPSVGYGLVNWTENGNQVSASPTYTFAVTGARTLVANFGFTNVTDITVCGTSYTWGGTEYTASGVYIGETIEGVIQKLNLTLTPNTTIGDETVSACGSSYIWPTSLATYTTSGTYTHVVGCNTATLTLTLTPDTTNTTTVSSFQTYTWANNGETYTTSGIKTGTTTNCVAELLDLTILTTEIPTTFPAFCKGATVATAKGATSMLFYAAATGGVALAGTTALATGKTLYVTEVINSVESTTRVGKLITVNNLPATPSLLVSNPLTESKNICKYIGTSTPVTFDVTAAGAVSYIWTAPGTATIASGGTGSSVGISFLDASTTAGAIGSVIVKSVDANGCISLPKALALTTKVPTAPASLLMTSADTEEHFSAKIPLSDPVAYDTSLSDLSKITKVGPYMGSSKVFTLTAPAAPTADHYRWSLPTGVNAIASASVTVSGLGVVTSTTPVITVNFADVASGIGTLPISVYSVGGCGESTARTLTLARALPTAPTKLVLTNGSQSNLSSLLAITKVGPYTGTNIAFTLTGTPFTTQGGTATSYAWVLPAGVVCTTCTETPDTTVSVSTTTITPITLVPVTTTATFAAFSSTTSTIPVNFSGVSNGITSLPVSLYAVNGSGNSKARTLTLLRALPTAPTKLVLTDGPTIVTKAGPYTAKTTQLTLTATPFATQGAEATSFSWVLPAGVNVTAGVDAALLTTPPATVGTTKTWTGTSSVLTINLAGIGAGVVSIPLSVYAVNGAGTSTTVRTLTLTSAVPTAPTITAGATTFSTCPGTTTTYTATAIPGATYTWGLPDGATGTSTTNSIVVDFTGATTAATYAITCIATNGTGPSLLKSLTIKKSTAACRLAPEVSVADDFNVIAYPNPSSNVFNIDVQSSDKGATGVQVYDMAGRLIESRQAKSNSVEVGRNYASGIYNVKVNKGAQVKTLRVIKR